MQLPDHENLHGCVKVILGDILECSMLDPFFMPMGARVHARWDTVINGERRTFRETFESNVERGSAQQQLEAYRPLVRSYFESEERARAKYGEDLPMPEIAEKGVHDLDILIRTTLDAARCFAQAVADGSMSRNNAEALAAELVSDIDRAFAALAAVSPLAASQGAAPSNEGKLCKSEEFDPNLELGSNSDPSFGAKSTPSGPTNVREPMPYIVPGAVRVCAHSDAECSRGCGDGPCKRGSGAGTHGACEKIREVIAAEQRLKQPMVICAGIRQPMPCIVPRVCAFSGAWCSLGCGEGQCKRGDEGGAA